jgi:hypothetical protein
MKKVLQIYECLISNLPSSVLLISSISIRPFQSDTAAALADIISDDFLADKLIFCSIFLSPFEEA